MIINICIPTINSYVFSKIYLMKNYGLDDS